MKILSISAQKPDSTGSGVFLKELVKVLSEQGHRQMVIAGVYPEDRPDFPEGVGFVPVCFCTKELPFPIAGMSDEMPYPSTRYCDMTPDMVQQFSQAFMGALDTVLKNFEPDLILCHHLYLLTALVREHVPHIPVYGFCHNTDLRQMRKHGLERDRIRRAVYGLDRIFVLRTDQKAEAAGIYGADPARMTAIGMGYNRRIFCLQSLSSSEKDRMDSPGAGIPEKTKGRRRLIYAGKLTQKKGVRSLIRSLSLLHEAPDSLDLVCAGGAVGRVCVLGEFDSHTSSPNIIREIPRLPGCRILRQPFYEFFSNDLIDRIQWKGDWVMAEVIKLTQMAKTSG